MSKKLKSLWVIAVMLIPGSSYGEEEREFSWQEITRMYRLTLQEKNDESTEQFKGEYYWGSRLSEVKKVVDEIMEPLKHALASGRGEDYNQLKRKIRYPLEFDVEEMQKFRFTDPKKEKDHFSRPSRGMDRHQAHNLEEAVYFLNRANSRANILTYLNNGTMFQEYEMSGAVTIKIGPKWITGPSAITISMVCEQSWPKKSVDNFRLPKDRKLCKKIRGEITHIRAVYEGIRIHKIKEEKRGEALLV
jgi:hypothetical protein